MKNIFLTTIIITMAITHQLCGQTRLNPGDSLSKKILFKESDEYIIKTKKGEFIELIINQKGIDLAITVSSSAEKEKSEFDSPNGLNGPELVSFESKFNSNYSILVKPLSDSINNAKSGKYSINYLKRTSTADYQKLLKQRKDEENEFVSWLKTNAIKLNSVKAETAFEDLKPLTEILTNKKVVGLGEASHGTKEFFQMKHRMLEFLVKEMGFNVFAIEASYSRCQYINEYVLNGKGSLDTATVVQGFTTWSTEEVKNMIQWMKDYNDENPKNKIQFVGYDLQVNDAAAFKISKFYEKVEPRKKMKIDSLLKEILNAEKQGGIFSGDTTIKSLIKPIEDLIIKLVERKGQYVQFITEAEYEESLWNHTILHQYLISYSYNNWGPVKHEDRDFYMAQNILSWLAFFPKGTKMVVWAHNGHIAKDFLDGVSYPSMGSYLKEILQAEYYAIGFDFYQGKFQSNDIDLKDSPGWEEHEVKEAPKGNLSYYFVQAGLNDSFIDFTLTTKSRTINKWINEKEIGTYSIGSQFSKNWPSTNYIAPTRLYKAFDGMIFIKESNRAVPVKQLSINNYKF